MHWFAEALYEEQFPSPPEEDVADEEAEDQEPEADEDEVEFESCLHFQISPIDLDGI